MGDFIMIPRFVVQAMGRLENESVRSNCMDCLLTYLLTGEYQAEYCSVDVFMQLVKHIIPYVADKEKDHE